MRLAFAIAALATAVLAAPALAQPAAAPSAPVPAASTPADWRPLDPDNTLVIDTTKGRVIVEMRPEIAPLAVARIKTLARRGYYDGALFYRVLKDYMAQGGDKGARTFRSDLPNLKAEFTFTAGPDSHFVSVGDIPDGQVGFIGSSPVTVMTAGPDAGKAWANFCPGAAAMPHYANPDTANSQLFFMRRAAPTLDKTFTVWGRVVSGMEVIQQLNDGEPPPSPDRMTKVRVMAAMPAAEQPKLEVMDVKGPAFGALFRETANKYASFTLCDLDLPSRGP